MIRGLITIAMLIANLILNGAPVALLGIVKFVVQIVAPRSRARTRVILMLASQAERWVAGNDGVFDSMLPTRWDVAGLPDDLRADGHYLIISNHRSWVDILVLFRVFLRRIAFIRFFLKQELIWFPIVGQGCWALEFPFMKRYSPEFLKEHPEKRGEDLATTRKACQRYRHMPVTIANFVEGTRFTKRKQAEEGSPYRHLLRPRAGGISYVLASLGDQLDAVIDVTLDYPGDPSIWRFISGAMPVIRVRARKLEVPAEFFAGEVTEPGPVRERLKSWLEDIWREKDALLDEIAGRG